jgi:hypothetical protein
VLAFQVSVTELSSGVGAKPAGVAGGIVAGATSTVADELAEPPAPVQVNVYVELDVGDTANDPDVARVPLQPPVAVQDVALVELQVRVEDCPAIMLEGDALSDTVGAGVDVEPPTTDVSRL